MRSKEEFKLLIQEKCTKYYEFREKRLKIISLSVSVTVVLMIVSITVINNQYFQRHKDNTISVIIKTHPKTDQPAMFILEEEKILKITSYFESVHPYEIQDKINGELFLTQYIVVINYENGSSMTYIISDRYVKINGEAWKEIKEEELNEFWVLYDSLVSS